MLYEKDRKYERNCRELKTSYEKLSYEDLEEEIYLKNQEIEFLKKELEYQLNRREAELIEYDNLLKSHNLLEKRYKALSQSTLGKLTLKYWRIRTRKKVKKGSN